MAPDSSKPSTGVAGCSVVAVRTGTGPSSLPAPQERATHPASTRESDGENHERPITVGAPLGESPISPQQDPLDRHVSALAKGIKMFLQPAGFGEVQALAYSPRTTVRVENQNAGIRSATKKYHTSEKT